MSKVYHVTYLIPPTESEESTDSIEENLDPIFGRRYQKLEGIDGVTVSFGENTVKTDRGAEFLMENLKKVSSELRIFIQPRNPDEDWICYPERFKEDIQKVVDRSDARVTALKVLQVLAD